LTKPSGWFWPKPAVRETVDLNKKVLQTTIAAIRLFAFVAVIAYLIFRSVDLSNQSDESTQTDSEKCENSAETQGCPASGPIIAAPYFNNGVIQGYLVYPGEDPDLFDSTGLEFGDLVTAVEGHPLTNVEQANQFLDSLIDGKPSQVTVERDGATKDIELLSD